MLLFFIGWILLLAVRQSAQQVLVKLQQFLMLLHDGRREWFCVEKVSEVL